MVAVHHDAPKLTGAGVNSPKQINRAFRQSCSLSLKPSHVDGLHAVSSSSTSTDHSTGALLQAQRP